LLIDVKEREPDVEIVLGGLLVLAWLLLEKGREIK